VRHGADTPVRVIVPELTADGPKRDNAALMERCDILFPELRAPFRDSEPHGMSGRSGPESRAPRSGLIDHPPATTCWGIMPVIGRLMTREPAAMSQHFGPFVPTSGRPLIPRTLEQELKALSPEVRQWLTSAIEDI